MAQLHDRWRGTGSFGALCCAFNHDQILYQEFRTGTYSTVIWGETGRVKNFEVILKIFRKRFLEFFSHKDT